MEADDMYQVILLSFWRSSLEWKPDVGSFAGYAMWKVKIAISRNLMWAAGFTRGENNVWVGAPLIPVGDDIPEVGVEKTPESLIGSKEIVDSLLKNSTPRQSVLLMSVLRNGSIVNGARELVDQPSIEEIGLVRDVVWIQKAILRTLKRMEKHDGDETEDETPSREVDRRGEVEPRQRRVGSESLCCRVQGIEPNVGTPDEAPEARRPRSRRRRSQLGSLVSSLDAC